MSYSNPSGAPLPVSFTAGATNSLCPGEYGTVDIPPGSVNSHTVVRLRPGTYYFDRLFPESIIRVFAGDNYSLALARSGRVYAWGSGTNGRTGLGSSADRLIPTPIDLPGRARALAAGQSHVLALLKDGSLYSWGYNYYRQVDSSTTTAQYSPVPITNIPN